MCLKRQQLWAGDVEMLQALMSGVAVGGAARRMLLWGALSGKAQLPPFPEPTHRALVKCCGGVSSLTPSAYMNCEVDFLSEASHAAAFPPVGAPPPPPPSTSASMTPLERSQSQPFSCTCKFNGRYRIARLS